jgi:hypothetical protein
LDDYILLGVSPEHGGPTLALQLKKDLSMQPSDKIKIKDDHGEVGRILTLR